MGPQNKKRKATQVEEINFDFAAREEYLTGFHKRKLQRIKHAQEEAAKKEKEERLRMRREVCTQFSLKKPQARPTIYHLWRVIYILREK